MSCNWVPLSSFGGSVRRPYYNPNTGDHLFSETNPGIPWIDWIPPTNIPPFNPNRSYITPDIIPFTQRSSPWIQYYPIIGPNPTSYIPLSSGPLDPFPPIIFIPTIFNPISPPDPLIFIPITIDYPPEDPEDFIIISSPDPTDTDSGYQLAIGGSALLVFIGSPSGIYTLVVDKKYDTLYNRTGAVSVDVAIPNPFIVTGFVGE